MIEVSGLNNAAKNFVKNLPSRKAGSFYNQEMKKFILKKYFAKNEIFEETVQEAKNGIIYISLRDKSGQMVPLSRWE